VRAVCLGALAAGSGCLSYAPVEFRLNTEGRDSAQIAPERREAITGALETLFGTPDRPALPGVGQAFQPDDVGQASQPDNVPASVRLESLTYEGIHLRLPLLERAAGPVSSDDRGNQFGLYRQHCASCHGLSGDGAGPTAGSQDPYPRDFRNGWFKYTSTAGGAKPVADDLDRIVRRGIPGTAMPSFADLPDGEIDALVEYVKYLSIRGECELYLVQVVVVEGEYLPLDGKMVHEDGVLPAARSWEVAPRSKVVPPPDGDCPDFRGDSRENGTVPLWPEGDRHIFQPETGRKMCQSPESIARGRALFLSPNARCSTCHGESGRGDGEQSELYDDWNKAKRGSTPSETRRLARLYALPIQGLRPRNLTQGIFHGGGEPEDIYWRIHVGIKGTPMPAGGPAPGSKGVLTPEEIWDVVHFVQSLSR
jgi:mono/diheme cytochrome c family protein